MTVIDMMEGLLRRQAENAIEPDEQQMCWAILRLYRDGKIEVEWRDGEFFYSRKK